MPGRVSEDEGVEEPPEAPGVDGVPAALGVSALRLPCRLTGVLSASSTSPPRFLGAIPLANPKPKRSGNTCLTLEDIGVDIRTTQR